MKMAEVRGKAKAMGLKVGRKTKADLIQSIQKAEGNNPCFGTSQGNCDQLGCCWREDCLPG